MALIPFPSEALVTRSELALQHPGQRVLRSLYGAGSQVLARGAGGAEHVGPGLGQGDWSGLDSVDTCVERTWSEPNRRKAANPQNRKTLPPW